MLFLNQKEGSNRCISPVDLWYEQASAFSSQSYSKYIFDVQIINEFSPVHVVQHHP